jgi:hypothetical protein
MRQLHRFIRKGPHEPRQSSRPKCHTRKSRMQAKRRIVYTTCTMLTKQDYLQFFNEIRPFGNEC